jgi:hypothetical protein
VDLINPGYDVSNALPGLAIQYALQALLGYLPEQLS